MWGGGETRRIRLSVRIRRSVKLKKFEREREDSEGPNRHAGTARKRENEWETRRREGRICMYRARIETTCTRARVGVESANDKVFRLAGFSHARE